MTDSTVQCLLMIDDKLVGWANVSTEWNGSKAVLPNEVIIETPIGPILFSLSTQGDMATYRSKDVPTPSLRGWRYDG